MKQPNWEKKFDKEFGKRLNDIELMAQLHGTPPWEGRTIQDFIRKTRQDAIKEDRKWISALLKKELSHKEFGRIIKELFLTNLCQINMGNEEQKEQTAIEYLEQLVRFAKKGKYQSVSIKLLKQHIGMLKKFKKIHWLYL